MKELPNFTTLLAELVAAPSVSSVDPKHDMPNRQAAECVASWLEQLGFSIEFRELGPGKVNLVATLGRGRDGLVLAGHLDTVPFDGNRWQSDPFKLTERNGNLYGLGSTDMKGFFPLIVEAMRGIKAADLKRPLTVIATADEESSMIGGRALLDGPAPPARYAVIGEPTNLLPVRLHKGITMQSICLTGCSGHSSNPALGNNALEGMHRVITALLAFRSDLQSRYRNDAFDVPLPTMNLGAIHGGDNPNRICGSCELKIDLRPLPGMDMDIIRQQLNDKVTSAVSGSGLTVEINDLFSGVSAFETPASSAIVQAAQKLTGAEPIAVNFATEGPFLNQLGIDTIIFGPGDIDTAHQPDEFLRLDRISPAAEVLRGLIGRFCIDEQLCQTLNEFQARDVRRATGGL